MKKCTMLINQKSSKYDAKKIETCKSIIKEHGYLPTLVFCKHDNFIKNFYEDAKKANETSDLVITYGGDGFFGLYQDILNKEGQKALTSHVPMGTANDMALNLGTSKRMIEATETLLHGEIKERDIITSNNSAFGYVSTFGPITNIPYDTPKKLKKLGPAGYLIAAMPDIIKIITRHYKPYEITVKANEKEKQLECLIGAVSNAKGFAGVEIFQNSDQNDGKFEVLLIKPQLIKKAPKLIKDFSKALIGKKETNLNIFENYENEIECFKTSDLQLSFNEVPKKHFDNDGDKGPLLMPGETITYQAKGKCKLLLPKTLPVK